MTSSWSLARSLAAAGGCAIGIGVFGWVRYYWVQHEVAWRPELRCWQYLLPVVAGLTLLLLGRARGGRTATRAEARRSSLGVRALGRLVRPAWPVGVGGAVLAFAQWQLAPREPWLLYAWMALLVWGAWLVAPRLRLADTSRHWVWTWVLAATAGMVILHVAMQLELWRLLSFGYRDIGLFTRALHNAARGEGLWVDSLGRSILGEHAFFALWALVPLCRIGVDPFGLLVTLSAVCLNGPAVIVAWYVRRRLKSNTAAVLAAIAWLLLPAHGCLVLAQGYGFHPIYMAAGPLLVGLALGALGRWRAAAACMLLCMAIREDLALTVAAWGVYVFFVPKRRVLGAAVLASAAAYLAFAVLLVVPHYRGEPYPHIAFHFGQFLGTEALVPSLLTNMSFLLALILPLAGLPLRNWRWACLALPSLAETMLTANVELHNLCFQYYTPAMVVLFFASMEAWRGMALRGEEAAPGVSDAGPGEGRHQNTGQRPAPGRVNAYAPMRRRLRAGWCLVFAAMVGQVYLGVGPLSNNPVRPSSPPLLRGEIDHIRRIRSLLPAGSSVTASYRIAAHFLDAARLWTVQGEHLGDVVIIHDLDRQDNSRPREALVRALRSGGYQAAFADYHLVMLIRDPAPTPLARELTPTQWPAGITPVSLDMGQGIALVGMGLRPIEGPVGEARRYRVTLLWECQARIEADYRFGLTLGEGRSRWGPFYFARGAYPTVVWQPGRRYRDDVEIVLPGGDSVRLGDLKPVLLE
ncbi:MAG: DUF2079 domain-containing protein [Phycisphaerae bacterium]|nr:DUF2079 domain-containing protein [Phycisphaerae bacterium]